MILNAFYRSQERNSYVGAFVNRTRSFAIYGRSPRIAVFVDAEMKQVRSTLHIASVDVGLPTITCASNVSRVTRRKMSELLSMSRFSWMSRLSASTELCGMDNVTVFAVGGQHSLINFGMIINAFLNSF